MAIKDEINDIIEFIEQLHRKEFDMNQVMIIGRLTNEVELRRVAVNEKKVAKFTIAVDSFQKDADGKRIAYFFDCECWDELGNQLWENLRKGDRVAITGYLCQYRFERKDGTNGSAVKIVAQQVDYLSPKHEDKKEQPFKEPDLNEVVSDEEVPF